MTSSSVNAYRVRLGTSPLPDRADGRLLGVAYPKCRCFGSDQLQAESLNMGIQMKVASGANGVRLCPFLKNTIPANILSSCMLTCTLTLQSISLQHYGFH